MGHDPVSRSCPATRWSARSPRVGEDVTHLQIGDRVGLGWHAGYCMTCALLPDRRPQPVRRGEDTIVGRHGGFADRSAPRPPAWSRCPTGSTPRAPARSSAAASPSSIPLVQFDVKPTDRVGVIGIGGLGHMALQFLRRLGLRGDGLHLERRPSARRPCELGAHHTINSRDPAAIEAAAGRFDLILSTVNVKLDWNAYLGDAAPPRAACTSSAPPSSRWTSASFR